MHVDPPSVACKATPMHCMLAEQIRLIKGGPVRSGVFCATRERTSAARPRIH